MKVCVVGQGGREHALALALAKTSDVVVTPGNPGMAGESTEGFRITTSPLDPWNIEADLVVIGPEQPLVDGLADRLRSDRKSVFGPGAEGAQLEGSKAFMKDVLSQAGVPTARYEKFKAEEMGEALEFLRQFPGPWVVKTDGLAAGKGVLVTTDRYEAEEDVKAKLSGKSFGAAGHSIVIEEYLSGIECSLLVVTDGTRVVPLAPAQDFKRIGDGDTGANTGGMGAYSPVAHATPSLVDRVLDEAVEPTLAALRRRGIEYRGVLYAGLMLTDDGPKILEYNVRFGDPETQVVLPRLDGDLTGLLAEASVGQLRTDPKTLDLASVCVVMAAEGYPSEPKTGDLIDGLDRADQMSGVTVVHSGTVLAEGNRIAVSGGRVLGVTAVAPTVTEARRRAYCAVETIGWPGVQFRRDIAARAAEEEQV